MKKIIFLLFIILVSSCSKIDNDTQKAQKIIDYNKNKYDDYQLTGRVENGVRVIDVKAYQFNFVPETIVVNNGEKIRLNIEAMDVPHGFEIEGFNIPGYDIDTVINPGEILTLEFIAKESGEWEFLCAIYCGYGHHDMKGQFIVK